MARVKVYLQGSSARVSLTSVSNDIALSGEDREQQKPPYLTRLALTVHEY